VQVCKDQQDRKAFKDHRDQLVLAHKDRKVRRVIQEYKGQQDHKDRKDRKAIKVLKDHKVPPGQLVQLVFRVLEDRKEK
jgi:hypothetical protein